MTPRPSSSVPAAPATEAAAAKTLAAIVYAGLGSHRAYTSEQSRHTALAALDALVSLVAATASEARSYEAKLASTEQQRDELKALVIQAYSSNFPTNGWRKRAEDLGAWPGSTAGGKR